MSHPTCCCSVSLGRCDRCDLLVGLEGFHLKSAARTPDALVLVVESCNHLVGCPGCGVIAQGHGRVVVEVIDAPWAGVPARIRWHNTALDVPRTHLPDDDIPGVQREGVCSPGASGDAGDLRSDPLGDPTVALRGSHHCRIGSTTGNHVEPRVVPSQAVPARPHLMTPPASQACGHPGSMGGVWHHQDAAAGAHVNSPASWTTRGKDHPTAHSLDLVPGRSGTVYKNGGPSAEKTCARGCELRRWIPFRG